MRRKRNLWLAKDDNGAVYLFTEPPYFERSKCDECGHPKNKVWDSAGDSLRICNDFAADLEEKMLGILHPGSAAQLEVNIYPFKGQESCEEEDDDDA